MIKIKTEKEIELIRRACSVAIEVISQLRRYLKPGIATEELDKESERLFKEYGAISAFKGYHGYPANICTSVNEEVVHGVPGERCLKEGDIVSLDVGVKLDGYFGDAACTFAVGMISPQAQQLLNVTRTALSAGIAKACEGNHLLDISSAIQSCAESSGYSVVRKFVGHGIGSQMHEEPEIPNFGKPNLGPILKAGMTLAIEPMINAGIYQVRILDDNWTIVTADSKHSVHFEHTIAATKDGCKILTI